jgi:hypothetical protein
VAPRVSGMPWRHRSRTTRELAIPGLSCARTIFEKNFLADRIDYCHLVEKILHIDLPEYRRE